MTNYKTQLHSYNSISRNTLQYKPTFVEIEKGNSLINSLIVSGFLISSHISLHFKRYELLTKDSIFLCYVLLIGDLDYSEKTTTTKTL